MRFLSREEVNNGRQFNLDLLKATAIVFMILCHPVLEFTQTRPVEAMGSIWYFISVYIFGSYLPSAHAFMFAMGIGIVFSKKSTPEFLIKRGVCIYILGYILNALRYGAYPLYLLCSQGVWDEWSTYCFMSQDILYFAGLALILTGVLQLLHLDEKTIFIISVIMSAIGAPLAFVFDTGKYIPNYIIGHFFVTIDGWTSCFTLFNWYIFVGFGLFFGRILKGVKEVDKFYKRLLVVSLCIAAVYAGLSYFFGVFFMNKYHWYYAMSIPEVIGVISIDLLFLSLYNFVRPEKLPRFAGLVRTMSKNVLVIYCIHWIILGNFDCFVVRLHELQLSFPEMYLFSLLLIPVSYFLAKLWKKLRGQNAG